MVVAAKPQPLPSHMRLILTLSSAVLLGSQLVAQWTPLSTGMLSNRSLCAHQGDLYCATYPNGIKKSVGGTGPFNAVNTGLPLVSGNCFAQSVGTDGTHLYAGTESGIYRSADGGGSWSIANGTLTASPTVYANKFFSFGGDIMAVFAGSIAQGGGIWRSGNSGDTWLVGNSGMGSNVVVNHLTLVGNTLWASTSVGLYTSTDNAQNWTAFTNVNYAVYSLASLNNTLVIACTYGIRYSTNGGNTWLDATGDPSAPNKGELIAFDGQLYTLFPSPEGCLHSTNNGVSWSDYNAGFSIVDAAAQEEFTAVGNTLYCTALFDVYSITATGTAVSGTKDQATTIFPTVFEECFFVRNNTVDGDLLLIDAAGRTVRGVRMAIGVSQFVERAGLASGAYRAVLLDRLSGRRVMVGTLIAR